MGNHECCIYQTKDVELASHLGPQVFGWVTPFFGDFCGTKAEATLSLYLHNSSVRAQLQNATRMPWGFSDIELMAEWSSGRIKGDVILNRETFTLQFSWLRWFTYLKATQVVQCFFINHHDLIIGTVKDVWYFSNSEGFNNMKICKMYAFWIFRDPWSL